MIRRRLEKHFQMILLQFRPGIAILVHDERTELGQFESLLEAEIRFCACVGQESLVLQ